MNTLVLDKKKYVVVPQEDYNRWVKKAALTNKARKFSLSEGKKAAYALIDKWHNER